MICPSASAGGWLAGGNEINRAAGRILHTASDKDLIWLQHAYHTHLRLVVHSVKWDDFDKPIVNCLQITTQKNTMYLCFDWQNEITMECRKAHFACLQSSKMSVPAHHIVIVSCHLNTDTYTVYMTNFQYNFFKYLS